jgi:hypothetical protein
VLYLYSCLLGSTPATESRVAPPKVAKNPVVDAALPSRQPTPEPIPTKVDQNKSEVVKIAKEWLMPPSGIPSADDFLEACASFEKGRLSTNDMTSTDGRSIRWAQCTDDDQNTRLQIVDLKSKESVALLIWNGSVEIAGDGLRIAVSLHQPSDGFIVSTAYLWTQDSLKAKGRVFPSTEFDLEVHGEISLNANRMACLAFGSANPKRIPSDLYADCMMGSELTFIDTWITPTLVEGGYACCNSDYQPFRYDLTRGRFSFPRTRLDLASFATEEDAQAFVDTLNAARKNSSGNLLSQFKEGRYKVSYWGYFSKREAQAEARILMNSKVIKKFQVVGRRPLHFTWKQQSKLYDSSSYAENSTGAEE